MAADINLKLQDPGQANRKVIFWLVLSFACFCPGLLWGQIKQDTVKQPTVTVSDSTPVRSSPLDELKPPISPKRAFLTSLLLPGYAQAKLDRPTASMIYAVFEVISIGMLRKSAQDLKAAKNSGRDSILVGYTSGNNGQLTPIYEPGRVNPERVKARKVHYEDWIAALAFNHLISAADAYVAAYLWDFKANIDLSTDVDGGRKAKIGFKKSF